MKLSLLITYRQRENHLKTQLAWWKSQQVTKEWEIAIIEADEFLSEWILAEIDTTNIKYFHLPCTSVFHKTKALNIGLSLAQGEFIAPFDVDLIPLNSTLSQHVKITQLSPLLLVTGYRVMLDSENLDFQAINRTTIAPEDQPTALWKQLIHQERFGVVPSFQRNRLLEIGGWNEKFVGWGARIKISSSDICKMGGFCLDAQNLLVYSHLPHPPNQHWTETVFTQRNKQHYYTTKKPQQF